MWIRILKNNFVYAIGSIANSAALFLLIPFLVNAFSTEEYGAWSIYEIMILFLSIFISAGMDIGLMREYWYLESEEERGIISGTVLMAVTIWGIVLFGILALGYQITKTFSIYTQLHLNSFPTSSLILVYFIGFTETLFSVLLAIFRIREQAIHFVAISVGKMVIFLGAAILGVRLTGIINGALTGRLLASTVGIFAAILFVFPMIKLKFAWKHLKRVLNYGMPLIPANLASYVLISSDRYILNATSTLTIVAVYSFVYKLASLLDILITRPFATDWASRRFQIATQKGAENKYADILTIYLFISSLAVLGIIALSPLIYNLIAPSSYMDGLKVLPVLLFAIQIYGLSYPLNVGLVIKDKTPTVAKIGVATAIFCIAIELWLIPNYGMVGAAWATLLSYLVWTAGVTILSLKVYPIPYKLNKIMGICLATIVGYIGLNWILLSSAKTFTSVGTLIISLFWLTLIFGITGLSLVKSTLRKPAS